MTGVVNLETRKAIQQFLDGSFTSLESLELVEELLKEEERTHAQLEREVEEACDAAKAVSAEASNIANNVHEQAMGLIDVHSQLAESAGSETSWEFCDGTQVMGLVSALAAELQTHQRLKQAKQYIDAFIAVKRTSEQAKCSLGRDAQGMLSAYGKVVALLANEQEEPGATISSAPHLRSYARQMAREIWTSAEQAASDRQSESLHNMGWPGRIEPSAADLQQFGSSFAVLAGLDRMAHDAHDVLERNEIAQRSRDEAPLALQHMVRQVDIRMRYHFESARGTSRADRPEWWLGQLLGMIRSLVPLLELHVQRLHEGSGLGALDVRNEFIRLALPIVQRKLARDREAYIANGLVVAQVVRELADFERTLQDVYFYDGAGVLDVLLQDDEVFAAWVDAERNAAMEAYVEGSAQLDAFAQLYEDDMVDADHPKPSRIAHRAVQLVASIADRYAAVPSCMRRLQMLATAQFPVMVALIEDVEMQLDEFSRLSLAFLRDTADGPVSAMQSPVAARLQRLATWYQTAWYVEDTAHDWNNQATYIDMWAAVCRHAAGSTDPRDWRDGCDDWDENDRCVLDDPDGSVDSEWLDGGIWERTAATLNGLKQRALQLMVQAVCKDVVGQLRAFRKKSTWASQSFDVDISPELSSLLPELAQLVDLLSSLLPFGAAVHVLRLLAAEIDTFIVDRVATAHSFNVCGGQQLAADVDCIDRILLSSAAGSTLRTSSGHVLVKAAECARVLACPLDDSEQTGDMALALCEWAPAVLDKAADDAEAAALVRKLGISHLDVGLVRQLVRCRVDFIASYENQSA
ncbi:hypothetical protein IWW36_003736 [Coemansia brasiliensis]|uniref:Uncharacterized protein n=1 Tax=Coemansia brasiliensis TaxID=2650707 RepID=A0A9W8LYN8_9FUNG|nr:hypothetical protein IWW36_003736 [Coemansia brasiliensis]